MVYVKGYKLTSHAAKEVKILTLKHNKHVAKGGTQ
jgi:hypothetical protein